ncbi:hypothetical protein LJ737_25465 [Hymenobacter sp. 15J16-1T3B]|uniref:hypothetical protein n=1 Tax=Hymenobacter sp. 15J16-1T3B TaxID=2886941 RepID=UPI001D0FC954|nr:hypothetical protein [Hymenobacter sp. 15J16-1T3B]MCC3160612.1 hypothetical protein [Hymenobacter sp. 15J16-1T3B]
MLRLAKLLLAAIFCLAARPAWQPQPTTLPSTERQQILQLLLDLPDLQGYYHAKLAQRLPVKLQVDAFATPGLRLRKFNHAVVLLTDQQLKQRRIRDYVRLGLLRQRQDTLDFRLGYAIEGVVAAGQLVRQPNGWRVGRYSVVEQ